MQHSLKIRVARAVLGAVALVGVAACADTPSSPASAASAASVAAPRLAAAAAARAAVGISRDTTIGRSVSTRIVVGPAGGSYTLPGGLRVTAPAGLFDTATTLTVTALPGRLVAYEFQPHGLVFRKPLVLQQELRGTNWASRASATLQVGYFESAADVSVTDGRARIREFLPVVLDPQAPRVQFEVHHFSGYMVTWGFDSQDAF
jgi:hypothetical protein